VSLQALGRALLLGLVRLCYRRPRPRALPDPIRKVLVVRTDTRVGNVLLTTPLVRALRRGLPGARVDFLVADGKQVLVAGLADRILPFRKKDFFRAPGRFWGFVRALRREQYDVVVEAGHWHAFSFTSLWLARATGAPVRIGHARAPSERFLTHEVVHDPATVREVAAKLELLQPLGLAAAGEALETTVDSAGGAALEPAARIGEQAAGRPVVALNPGARKPDHRWPAEGFGALSARLGQAGAFPVVLWGPGEEAIAAAVVASSSGQAHLAPRTDLPQLAAVFRSAAVVVTNDTGPMHLAVATGAPVVAVLLAEDGSRWSHGGRFSGVPVRTGTPEEVESVYRAVLSHLNRT
jgi:ADP-heptose:LPS heptosyltransferase